MYDLEKISFWRLIIVVELIARKHISDAKLAKDTNSTTPAQAQAHEKRRKGTSKAEKKLAEQSRHRSRLALANLWLVFLYFCCCCLSTYPGHLHNNTYKIIGSLVGFMNAIQRKIEVWRKEKRRVYNIIMHISS